MWDINNTMLRLQEVLKQQYPDSRMEREGKDVLVFWLNGKEDDSSFSYFVLRFSTYFNNGIDEVWNASEHSRTIKCKDLKTAKIIADIMIGEEVWQSEYLDKILSITPPS